MHLRCANVRVNEPGRRNWSVEEVARRMLPICAIFKKASMGAAYAADPFCFGRSSRTEDLRNRAAEKLTVSC